MTPTTHKPTPITVLGTGVSGLTTALTLQLLGFDTQLIGDKFVTQKSSKQHSDSLFASLYPAASIIPHSVNSDRLEVLFNDSQKLFRTLYQSGLSSIRRNKHYEWFRYPVDTPFYSDWMDHFSKIDPEKDSLSRQVFNNQSKKAVNGWTFTCFFVDWPKYASKLLEWYKASGGECKKKQLAPNDLQQMSSPLLVNCTGARSRELFEDEEDFCFLLGKSLIVEDAPKARELSSIITYNYTPGAETYSHSSGSPVDLYCYPRNTGWVLGGSRLHGHLDSKGRWKGEEWTNRMLSIDKQQIPAPIYEINRELIHKIYDIDLADYSLRVKSGYRFLRDSKTDGLRLEKDQQYKKTVFHNYGHGGAGVTISWGSALQVARMIRNYTKPDNSSREPQTKLLEEIGKNLRNLL